MNPVIKWPGGKRREIKYIEHLIPENVNRIVEPFFGGGAFSLNFIDKYKVFGSDIDRDLVHFYNLVSNKEFLEKLDIVSKWWDSDEVLEKLNYKKLKKFEIEKFFPTAKHKFYYACRNMYNFLKLNDIYDVDRAIMFYMMRELSFSSMFRFNSNGEFNVPYGGYAYNKKSMRNKFNLIKELSTKKIEVILSDFINVIERYKNDRDTLIFLDPPYDSVFKDYNSNSFGECDQIRLRDSLMNSEAKVIMIINKTDFIMNLYKGGGFVISSFDKQYSVNFKNRNIQKVKHLIIKNF